VKKKPKRKTKSPKTPPHEASPIEKLWLMRQFAQIDDGIQEILDKINEIAEAANANVTPELEAAVNRSATLSKAIDRKVPD
jgi:hypothetical protein